MPQVEEPLEHFFRTLARRSLYTETSGGQLVKTMASCRTLERYHRAYIPHEPLLEVQSPQVIFLDEVDETSEEETRSLSDQQDPPKQNPPDLLSAAAATTQPSQPAQLEHASSEESDSSLMLLRTPVLRSKRASGLAQNCLCANESKASSPPTPALRTTRKRRHETSAAAELSSAHTAHRSRPLLTLPADRVISNRCSGADSLNDANLESMSDMTGDSETLTTVRSPLKLHFHISTGELLISKVHKFHIYIV